MNGERRGKKTEREIRCLRKVKDWERRGNGPSRISVMWSQSAVVLGGRKDPRRAGGDEGVVLGGSWPSEAISEGQGGVSSLLKNSVNSGEERLSLITEQAASCILSPAVSHH